MEQITMYFYPKKNSSADAKLNSISYDSNNKSSGFSINSFTVF